MTRSPFCMERKCLRASGLLTPSQTVVPSRTRSSNEYVPGSVFMSHRFFMSVTFLEQYLVPSLRDAVPELVKRNQQFRPCTMIFSPDLVRFLSVETLDCHRVLRESNLHQPSESVTDKQFISRQQVVRIQSLFANLVFFRRKKIRPVCAGED